MSTFGIRIGIEISKAIRGVPPRTCHQVPGGMMRSLPALAGEWVPHGQSLQWLASGADMPPSAGWSLRSLLKEVSSA